MNSARCNQTESTDQSIEKWCYYCEYWLRKVGVPSYCKLTENETLGTDNSCSSFCSAQRKAIAYNGIITADK